MCTYIITMVASTVNLKTSSVQMLLMTHTLPQMAGQVAGQARSNSVDSDTLALQVGCSITIMLWLLV